MILQKRIDRAFDHLREKAVEKTTQSYEGEGNGQLPIEKGDISAMIISAMIVILPVTLAALMVMALVGALCVL